jgi:hypothetical protein
VVNLRVQWRARTPGWRAAQLPEGTVYVGRARGARGRWGNPFDVREHGRDEAVQLHREWLLAQPDLVSQVRAELAGWHLACWCPLDQPCHADTLVEVANTQAPAPAVTPRAVLKIENYAEAKAAFLDRRGVNDTLLDRHERADRRRAANAAWSTAIAAVRTVHRAKRETS